MSVRCRRLRLRAATGVLLGLAGLAAGCTAERAGAECRVAAGLDTLDLHVGDLDYQAEIYQPDGTEGRRPVVIDFHGLGGNGAEQAERSQFRALADREGFAVVEPTGRPSAFDARGWELSMIGQRGRDDVAYVEALVDDLVERHCVDPARVYVAGFSNGGFLASELACELADRIAAAAAVAGTTWIDDCRPARPAPLLSIHGTADQVVPYRGDVDSVLFAAGVSGWAQLLRQSIPAEVAQAARAAGCAFPPRRERAAPGVIRATYRSCTGGAVVDSYRITGGGHEWPGQPGPQRGVDSGFQATPVIWDFFSRFRRSE